MANPIGHSAKKPQGSLGTIEDKEIVTKMNVNVPKGFYKKIKQQALDEDTSVTAIVIKALNLYLNKAKQK